MINFITQDGSVFISFVGNDLLKEKRVLKQCPWAPFWKTLPFLHYFWDYFGAPEAAMAKQWLFGEWQQNGAQKGTILRMINGHRFWCHLFF